MIGPPITRTADPYADTVVDAHYHLPMLAVRLRGTGFRRT
jgi:hypothetical protein